MLTKTEIMGAFSKVGCNVEEPKAEENWFLFTKDQIHYEVQIDVEWDDPDDKYMAILCPTMGKVQKKYGHILEHAVEMLQADLMEQGINQYQVNYEPDECSVDSCGIMAYGTRNFEELCNSLDSFFIFDANVNETIQKNVVACINAMKPESDEPENLDENRYDLFPLQFMWIPALLEEVNNDYEKLGILVDFNFWKESIHKMGFETFGVEWDDIKFDVYSVNDNLQFVLYTFPFPQREGLALHGAVMIDKTGSKPYKYYTLEHPGDDYLDEDGNPTQWFVCSQTGDEHENYGMIEYSSTSDFVNAVLSFYDDLLSE